MRRDSDLLGILGFEEAAKTGATWVHVCRSIVSDRSFLLIPAWVLLGGLVLAAVLIRVSYGSRSAEKAPG